MACFENKLENNASVAVRTYYREYRNFKLHENRNFILAFVLKFTRKHTFQMEKQGEALLVQQNFVNLGIC